MASMPALLKQDSDLAFAVTEEDIRLFRCTLLARRFPGLRELLDEDIKLLILSDRKAADRKKKALQKTHPNSDFTPPPHIRELPVTPAPYFKPVNQAEARHTVRRANDERFIGLGTPFELEHGDCFRDATSDMSKRGMGGPFKPNSPSEARTAIQVDYYLNSYDSATKMSQRYLMDQRASLHKEQYRELYQSRRGKTLMS